ncbi:MAG: YczE/YyaS/YitT family protein [Acidimicrobiales bacterium]
MASLAAADRRTTIERLPRLMIGLILCGVGIALMVDADLGLAPWDVLHQGVNQRTGIAMGTVGILVGVVVLLVWVPLKERFGVGTVLNVITIGVTIDVALPLLPDHPALGLRWAFLVTGALLLGPAGGLYIGVGLGAGPRDGLMTALAARGWSVRVVRTSMELAVLLIGWALGGSVGIGTVLFAVTIGPNVHFWLERLTLPGVLPPAEGVIEVE